MSDEVLIEDAVFELIKNFAAGKVYLARAPQNAEGPFIIYKLNDGTRWRSINHQSDIKQDFIQVDCYHPLYKPARKLGQSVGKALIDYTGNVQISDSPPAFIKIAGISFENDVMLLDQEDEPYLYRHSAIYKITYHE